MLTHLALRLTVCGVLNMSLWHGDQPSAQFLPLLYNRILAMNNTQYTPASIKWSVALLIIMHVFVGACYSPLFV